MNATLLGLNAASMGYFFMDPSLGAGLGCLGAATVLSTTMGATLTAAIGGTNSFSRFSIFFSLK
jgi:NAD(P) transhydrogenase